MEIDSIHFYIILKKRIIAAQISSHLPTFHRIFFNKCHSLLEIHSFLSWHMKLDIKFHGLLQKNSRIMKCSEVLNSFLTVGFYG
jgi:hypothetical protein